MNKKLFFIFCLIIGLFIVANRAKATEAEANLYMRELKLVFGDKHCEKVLKRYVFADCHYNNYKKGEPMKFDDKRTLEFGSLHRQKCLNLLSFRKACILKHEQNSTAEIVDFALENKKRSLK